MPDTWADIHGPDGPVAKGYAKAASRHETPTVRRPTCPTHCSGRHMTDGVLVCPDCRVPAYNVVGHEWLYTEGHYWWSLEARNGSPPVPQGTYGTPKCADCGQSLRRESA